MMMNDVERIERWGDLIGLRPAVMKPILRLTRQGAGSISGALAAKIGEAMQAHCTPGHMTRNETHLFTFPAWLVCAPGPHSAPKRPLRVRLNSKGRLLSVNRDWSATALEAVRLSPRLPQHERRGAFVETATILLQDMECVSGTSAQSDWLREIIANPERQEARALSIWERFLAICYQPRALRLLSDQERSLQALRIITKSENRLWFADEWPWVAASLLRQGTRKANQTFREIDKSRAAAVHIATGQVCCQQARTCEKARMIARVLPKYKDSMELAHLLGKGQDGDNQIRALLVEANYDEQGALVRRLIEAKSTRAHFEFARQAALALVRSSPACKIEVGKLIARSLAGCDETALRALAPHILATGLVTIAADCIAAHIASSSPQAEDERHILDQATISLVQFLSAHHLTPTQLTRLAMRGASSLTGVDGSHQSACWPAPLAWRATDRISKGVTVQPLLSTAALRTEGRSMENCLRYDTSYVQSAWLGHLSIFSVQARSSRATLSVREQSHNGTVLKYEIEELAGVVNKPPSPECRDAAQALVARLNARLPIRLPREEALRRRRVSAKLSSDLCYNPNISTADKRWQHSYLPILPKRCWQTAAKQVVIP